MKIQVGGLSEGLHTYSFTISPGDLGLPPEFNQDVSVEAELEKSGGEFLLRARVSNGATWECDRCVAQFSRPASSEYQMYYISQGADAARYDPVELQALPAGVTVIDITDDVRQTVLLSVPLKRVCREDCRGLCPHCGKNLNEGPCGCVPTLVDGRWDKLKELQNNTKHDVR
jgi:uncharacterized protein